MRCHSLKNIPLEAMPCPQVCLAFAGFNIQGCHLAPSAAAEVTWMSLHGFALFSLGNAVTTQPQCPLHGRGDSFPPQGNIQMKEKHYLKGTDIEKPTSEK